MTYKPEVKETANTAIKPTVAVPNDARVGVSIGGYFVGLGTDNEKYGAGAITILQGKNLLAKFSYVDWQKLDAFLSQHSELFNKQLDKELATISVVKRR